MVDVATIRANKYKRMKTGFFIMISLTLFSSYSRATAQGAGTKISAFELCNPGQVAMEKEFRRKESPSAPAQVSGIFETHSQLNCCADLTNFFAKSLTS